MTSAHAESFKGRGGLRIHMRAWPAPSGTPRAIVILVHGFKAHSALYEWAAEKLRARGFAVYAHDHRGHGKSDGERLYCEHFNDYVDDLHALVRIARSREPDVPLFVLGHSAGGVIAAHYVLEHQDDIAGLVTESFAFEIPAPNAVLSVLKGLSAVAPHLHVLELPDAAFSRNEAFVARIKNDPLIPHERYPAQTVAELVRADQRLAKELPNFRLPLLILHGTKDKVTRPHGSQRFHDDARSNDKTLRLYDGYYHDLLNDIGRERVMADIIEWIELRLR